MRVAARVVVRSAETGMRPALIVLAVWLTVAWAGRRMTTGAIRAGRMPVSALRTTTRAATRTARRQIERGL